MPEQSISASKVFICIVDIVISILATSYFLDTCTTRQEFIFYNAIIPWLALIGYFPTALFLGNSLLTRVVRTLIFIWFAYLAYSLYGCVDILAMELDTMDAIPEMRKVLLPVPYISLLLAFACLLRCSPKRISGAKPEK